MNKSSLLTGDMLDITPMFDINPPINKLVQTIQESICGSEWLAKQIMEEQEHNEKQTGYIFTWDSENVE